MNEKGILAPLTWGPLQYETNLVVIASLEMTRSKTRLIMHILFNFEKATASKNELRTTTCGATLSEETGRVEVLAGS